MEREIITVNEGSFDKVVLKADKPVLVDFWAPWCVPCLSLAPVLEELAKEFKAKCQFARLNVDENHSIATRYNIMSIPTLILFRGGKPKEQWVGFRSKEELAQLLEEALY